MFLEGGEYWQQKIAALSEQEEISLGQQQLLDCLVQEDPADSPAVQKIRLLTGLSRIGK